MEFIVLLFGSQIVEKFFSNEEIREQNSQVATQTQTIILGRNESSTGAPGKRGSTDLKRVARWK